MTRYLLRRLITSVLMLLVIATIAFAIMRSIPGGPYDDLLSRGLSAAQIHAMEEALGLHDPLPVQYIR